MSTASLLPNPSYPSTGGWKDRHTAALRSPKGVERPIVHLARALESYCDLYRDRYGCSIGNDHILGHAAILPMIQAFRVLLNGELGGLDAGTLDAWAVAKAKEIGFSEEYL